MKIRIKETTMNNKAFSPKHVWRFGVIIVVAMFVVAMSGSLTCRLQAQENLTDESNVSARDSVTIKINNKSSYTVDIYYNDELVFEDISPSGKTVSKGYDAGTYALYIEANDGSVSWGPLDLQLASGETAKCKLTDRLLSCKY